MKTNFKQELPLLGRAATLTGGPRRAASVASEATMLDIAFRAPTPPSLARLGGCGEGSGGCGGGHHGGAVVAGAARRGGGRRLFAPFRGATSRPTMDAPARDGHAPT